MARLPSAYCEVEWIESPAVSGSIGPYINTGVSENDVYGFELKFMPVTFSEESYASILSGTIDQATLGYYITPEGLYLRHRGQEIVARAGMISTSDWSILLLANNGFWINSTQFAVDTTNSWGTSGRNILIFNNHNWNRHSVGKVSHLIMYDSNGEQIRNFVPCYRVSDTEVGLYDTVNGVFYANQGTGAFSKGPNTINFPDFRAVKNFYIGELNIPEEYQEVDYIESTGTQYINTGISTSGARGKEFIQELEICLTGTSSSDYQVFSGNDCCQSFDVGKNSTKNGDIEFLNQWHKVKSQRVIAVNRSTWVDDVLVTSGTTTYIYSAPVCVFCSYFGSAFRFSKAKIKYYKLYIEGTLVRNMIPCYRKSDGVIGMYDTVDSTFYTNAGSGTFIKGNDVHTRMEIIKISIPSGEVTHNLPTEYQEVEYIESDGTQWINSGIASQVGHKHTFEGTISITSNNGDRETVWGNDYTDLQQNTLLQYAELGEKATWTYYHSLIDDSSIIQKNGVTVSSGSYRYSGNATIAIFSSYFANSSIRKAHIKLFELKIYYDNETTPIRHFIPCYRKSDGVIGLYDIINGAFHTKQSGNDFTKGEDITCEIVLWEKPEQ